jgi:hypothetical protein
MSTLSKADKKRKISQAEANRRRTVALARIREMEADRLAGKLIDRTEVERVWFENARLIRDGILNIPDRLASLLASVNDPHKVHQLLDAELRKALDNLADAVSTVH